MKYLIRLIIILVLFQPVFLYSENQPTAQQFMEMNTEEAFSAISKMNKEDSTVLITQIRKEAKKDYKKIDNFYFLISHLEEIKAVEIEQNRLRSLHLVYILALLLFLSFLIYVFINQRKIIKELNSFRQD